MLYLPGISPRPVRPFILILALMGPGAGWALPAQELADEPATPKKAFVESARALENNFLRVYGQIDRALLRQHSTADAQTLLAAQRFQPAGQVGVAWKATALDSERVRLCLMLPTKRGHHWLDLVQAGLSHGWLAADKACQPLSTIAAPLTAKSAQSLTRIMDRRDVPTRSAAIGNQQISGFDDSAVTRPGLTLVAGQARVTLLVRNPFVVVVEGPPVQGLHVQLSELTIREGFEATHTCANVGPDQTCTIAVEYLGKAGDDYTGALEGVFSDGSRFRVTLLGRLSGQSSPGASLPAIPTEGGSTPNPENPPPQEKEKPCTLPPGLCKKEVLPPPFRGWR